MFFVINSDNKLQTIALLLLFHISLPLLCLQVKQKSIVFGYGFTYYQKIVDIINDKCAARTERGFLSGKRNVRKST